MLRSTGFEGLARFKFAATFCVHKESSSLLNKYSDKTLMEWENCDTLQVAAHTFQKWSCLLALRGHAQLCSYPVADVTHTTLDGPIITVVCLSLSDVLKCVIWSTLAWPFRCFSVLALTGKAVERYVTSDSSSYLPM
jgi:hypothetical protein